MKEKLSEKYKIYNKDNEAIYIKLHYTDGKMDIEPPHKKEFRFWGSDPERVKRIGKLLVEASKVKFNK